MFFSSNFKVVDIAETVRSIDTVVACAKDLRTECEDYDFGLVNSYKDADDLKKSCEVFKQNRPATWLKFFKSMLNTTRIPEDYEISVDLIFQIFHALIHRNTNLTPFSVGIAQVVHEKCRNNIAIKQNENKYKF